MARLESSSYTTTAPSVRLLSDEQIETYLRDGVLVVNNVLTNEEVQEAFHGLNETLRIMAHVDTDRLEETAHHLAQLSSTGGTGGVLDVFYQEWQIRIATHAKLFQITQELWAAAYTTTIANTNTQMLDSSDKQAELPQHEHYWKCHPYGSFDYSKGYVYFDRIGYRLPTMLVETLTTGSSNTSDRDKTKSMPIQRSLTPHLDCCPDNLFENTNKWRPIQCFVSLTDNMKPNTGGFEAAKGFHHDFTEWATHRPPTVIRRHKKKQSLNKSQQQQRNLSKCVSDCDGHIQNTNDMEQNFETISFPAPCVGQYTHIRPHQDAEVLERVQHVPNVSAGSAVFWDIRIPHANSYHHSGTKPRIVVYTSFLPDIALNRKYVQRQLADYLVNQYPTDQWITTKNTTPIRNNSNDDKSPIFNKQSLPVITNPLARKLIGLDPW